MSEELNDIVVGIFIIIISVTMILAQIGIALLIIHDLKYPLQGKKRRLDRAFTILLIVLIPINLFNATNLLFAWWRSGNG